MFLSKMNQFRFCSWGQVCEKNSAYTNSVRTDILGITLEAQDAFELFLKSDEGLVASPVTGSLLLVVSLLKQEKIFRSL